MRGLLAQLSPKEAGVLKLISSGAAVSDSPSREIEQLKKLGLIEVRNGSVEVTRLGRQRLMVESRPGNCVPKIEGNAALAGD